MVKFSPIRKEEINFLVYKQFQQSYHTVSDHKYSRMSAACCSRVLGFGVSITVLAKDVCEKSG